MNWFKRLCLFVFGVSGILALVALSLTWVGPWTTQARSMLELPWYFLTLEVLVCLCAAGLLVCTLVSLFAPRNPKETVVAKAAGGKITVTRSAIISQARHVIESDGSCLASAVRVRMRKHGHVRVLCRVTPRRPLDLIARGETLHAELEEGLSHICGDCVKSIDVVFNEPDQQGPMRTYVEQGGNAEDSAPTGSLPSGGDVPVPLVAPKRHTEDETLPGSELSEAPTDAVLPQETQAADLQGSPDETMAAADTAGLASADAEGPDAVDVDAKSEAPSDEEV